MAEQEVRMPSLETIRKELARRKQFNKVTITEYNKEKVINLPDYGEIKIVCHDGKVKMIETTVKEQM